MILEIFAIYDSKAKAYLPPFFLPEIEVAKRVFKDASNDKSHAFGANPGDYTLFHIGKFNDDNAHINMKKIADNLGIAIQFLDENVPQTQMDLPSITTIPEVKLNSEGDKL